MEAFAKIIMKNAFFSLLLLLFLQLPGLAEKLTFKFTRTGSGGGGGTILWQGVVVDVEDNTVAPKYTIHHRIFFSRWDDFPATAIKACLLGSDGFSSDASCVVFKGPVATIPEGKTPYDYSYKFQFSTKSESKAEESFLLDKDSLLNVQPRPR